MRIPRPVNRVKSGVISDREAYTMMGLLFLVLVGAALEVMQMSANQLPLP
jgi:hypothetical protein